MSQIACIAISFEGAKLARKLCASHGGKYKLFVLADYAQENEKAFTNLKDFVSENWHKFSGFAFVCSLGIVVRIIAKHLKHKAQDPAVVVCDQAGNFVISVLSGHLGGANELSYEIANMLGATPVITTATDVSGIKAIDLIAKENKLSFSDYSEIKNINKALLDNKEIALYDENCFLKVFPNYFRKIDRLNFDENLPSVSITLSTTKKRENLLRLHPYIIHIGIGCKKNIYFEPLAEKTFETLENLNIDIACVAGIHSIDLKAEENALHKLAKCFKLQLKTWDRNLLASYDVPNKSLKAAKLLGVEQISVCEAAALCGAGANSKLILEKQKHGDFTLAIAMENIC